jgi:hypothetical protein
LRIIGESLRVERIHLFVDGLRGAFEGEARESIVGHLQVLNGPLSKGHLSRSARMDSFFFRYGHHDSLFVVLAKKSIDG